MEPATRHTLEKLQAAGHKPVLRGGDATGNSIVRERCEMIIPAWQQTVREPSRCWDQLLWLKRRAVQSSKHDGGTADTGIPQSQREIVWLVPLCWRWWTGL